MLYNRNSCAMCTKAKAQFVFSIRKISAGQKEENRKEKNRSKNYTLNKEKKSKKF